MHREPNLRLLHDALSHLHELPLMPSHALGTRLGRPFPVAPSELQRLLRHGIERMRPPPSVPSHASRWRQHQYLQRRYLDGASVQEIQTEMAVGARQVRREYQAALRTLALLIGLAAPTELGGTPPNQATVSPSPTISADTASPSPEDDPLRAELARLDLPSLSEPTDLAPLLGAVLALIKPVVARRGVHLEMTLPDQLPAVVVVRSALQQLVLNLLSVLIDHGHGRRLVIAATALPDQVALEIRMAGPPNARARDAPPLPAMADRRLIAARQLAEGQGGRLDVASTGGALLAAHVYLPMARSTTVLVIDDNPDIGLLFRRYLQGAGFRVEYARNGPGALALVGTIAPDLVILDLVMPIQDGWEVFQRLKHAPATARLPIIACSVLPERELALSLGVDGFLPKPVTRHGLLAAVQAYRRPDGPGSPDSL